MGKDTPGTTVSSSTMLGRWLQGVPATYTIWKNLTDGKYYAECNVKGGTDFESTDLTDAQTVIASALAASPNGGALAFRQGIYECSAPIVGVNSLSFEGENMGSFENFAHGTVLRYTGGAADTFLDFRDIRYFNISNLKIKNAGSATRGLYMGGTNNNALRTKGIHLCNVTIDGFAYGIQGFNYPPDDSTYDHCWIMNNTTCGIDFLSSQSRFIGGSVYGNPIGVKIRRTAAAHPDTSMQFFGTVFGGATTAIDIAGEQNIRFASFNSCWFEDISNLILNTQNATAGLYLGHVLFENCGLYTNAGATAIFDLRGRSIVVQVHGGEIYPTDNPTTILTDGTGGTYQTLNITGPPAGIERVSFTNTNASTTQGLRGMHQNMIPIYVGTVDTDTGCSAAAWAQTAIVPDIHIPYRAYTTLKCYVTYDWDPKSASGKVRLESPLNTVITDSTINGGGAGLVQNVADISTDMRLLGFDGHLVTSFYGDGANAPHISRIYLTTEW